MTRYVFVVHSNPVEGREDEYNDWYSNRHLDDLRAIPGVVAANRLVLADQQVREPPFPYKYLALYEIETDDLKAVVDELTSRAGTKLLPRSDALANDVLPVFWKVMK
jgi:hypothetical protein